MAADHVSAILVPVYQYTGVRIPEWGNPDRHSSDNLKSRVLLAVNNDIDMLLWKFMCTHKQPVTNQQESFEGRLSYPL